MWKQRHEHVLITNVKTAARFGHHLGQLIQIGLERLECIQDGIRRCLSFLWRIIGSEDCLLPTGQVSPFAQPPIRGVRFLFCIQPKPIDRFFCRFRLMIRVRKQWLKQGGLGGVLLIRDRLRDNAFWIKRLALRLPLRFPSQPALVPADIESIPQNCSHDHKRKHAPPDTNQDASREQPAKEFFKSRHGAVINPTSGHDRIDWPPLREDQSNSRCPTHCRFPPHRSN